LADFTGATFAGCGGLEAENAQLKKLKLNARNLRSVRLAVPGRVTTFPSLRDLPLEGAV
jgi:hypothetical protein